MNETSITFDDGMILEWINDKQVRCILKGIFFQTYHFTLSQLHFDTNQIQEVLTMIHNRAKYHISFNLANDPVIYESVPLIRGAAVLFISKEHVVAFWSKEYITPSDLVTFEDGLCLERIHDRQISVTIQACFLDKCHISVMDFQQKTSNAQACMTSILRRLKCYFKCDKSVALKLDSIAYNEGTVQFLIVPEQREQIIDNRFPDPAPVKCPSYMKRLK